MSNGCAVILLGKRRMNLKYLTKYIMVDFFETHIEITRLGRSHYPEHNI